MMLNFRKSQLVVCVKIKRLKSNVLTERHRAYRMSYGFSSKRGMFLLKYQVSKTFIFLTVLEKYLQFWDT